MLGLGNTIVNDSFVGGIIVTDFNTTPFIPYDYYDTRYIILVANILLGSSSDDAIGYSSATQNDQLTDVSWTLKVARVDASLNELETSTGTVYAYAGPSGSGGSNFAQILFSDDNSPSIDTIGTPGTPFGPEGSSLINIKTFGGVDVTDGVGTDTYVVTLTGVRSGYQDMVRTSIPVTFETV